MFFAYAVVTHDSATLFVDPGQVDDVVRKHLGSEVEILDYDAFFPYLKGFVDKLGMRKDVVCFLFILSNR